MCGDPWHPDNESFSQPPRGKYSVLQNVEASELFLRLTESGLFERVMSEETAKGALLTRTHTGAHRTVMWSSTAVIIQR
jgi:hypothetical protein